MGTTGEDGLAEARRAAAHLAAVLDRLMAGCLLNRAALAELAEVVADEALPAAKVYEGLVHEAAGR